MHRPFVDRAEAASILSGRLAAWRGQRPLVLAVPRGGVPIGRAIADELGGELDVVLVHKLGAPGNPEYAIGAVEESGHVTLNADARRLATAEQIRDEARRQLETLHERRLRYSAGRPAPDPAGRVVVVVDDGVATGSSLLAALHAIRDRRPAQLIAATGVAPRRTANRLRESADVVVCGQEPDELYAVGAFFEEFPQVSDEEVERLLRDSSQQRS
jgi:predicted phosphoribosyltransferase